MVLDYSKFDSIVDSDDEKEVKAKAESKAPSAPEKPTCQNCGKDITKPLRCGICKKVSYCSQECQKSDWPFHKRNCKKPEAPKPKASPAEKEAKKEQKEEKKKRDADEKVVDEGDESFEWYKHREWKPTAEPKQEFKPMQISEAQAVATASSAAPSAGSIWNKAGTWEEKDVTALAISSLQQTLETPALPSIDAAGGSLSVESIGKVEGDASKPVIRGKQRHIFDLSFEVKFVFKWMDAGGQQKASGSLSVSDFTNDAFNKENTNEPVLELTFSPKGLDVARRKAVEDAIGAKSWPPPSGTFTAALAVKMKQWSDDFVQLDQQKKQLPEASREKVVEMRDSLKKARTESNRDSMMSLLKELSEMRVSLDSMKDSRLGVELKSCSEEGGEEAKKLCDQILAQFLNKCEI